MTSQHKTGMRRSPMSGRGRIFMKNQYTFTHDALEKCLGIMMPRLNEQDRRIFAAALGEMLGPGGMECVGGITGLSQTALAQGRRECAELVCTPRARTSADALAGRRIRKEGGGRKRASEANPGLLEALDGLIDGGEQAAGCGNALRWTTKGTGTLSRLLKELGHNVSSNTVARELRDMGFVLQPGRGPARKGDRDRDAQFRLVNEQCRAFSAQMCPVFFAEAKKVKTVWKDGHILPFCARSRDEDNAVAGDADIRDAAESAVARLCDWLHKDGSGRFPHATRLLFVADCGEGHRARTWKTALPELADRSGLSVHVLHFPPGTTKWDNKKHLFFSEVTSFWKGHPPETVVIDVSLVNVANALSTQDASCMIDNAHELGTNDIAGNPDASAIEEENPQDGWSCVICSRYPVWKWRSKRK